MNLRDEARGQHCYLRLACCTRESDSVVLAHIRRGNIAGVGQKPTDLAAFPCCVNCHDEFDSRTNSGLGRALLDAEALRALVQWLAWLDKNGKIKVLT